MFSPTDSEGGSNNSVDYLIFGKKKPKSRSNKLCMNLLFDIVEPNVGTSMYNKKVGYTDASISLPQACFMK